MDGFWIFCTLTPAASSRIRSAVFFAVAGLNWYFVFVGKTLLVFLHFFMPSQTGAGHTGTGSGADCDWNFAKHD